MTSILIAQILVEDRQRQDYSEGDSLKDSLAQFGTIHPIVLEEQPDNELFPYRLIAGGRRLACLKELGHTELFHASAYDPKKPGFVFGRELQRDELHELELEENLRRKPMTWQEHCLALCNLHRLKVARLGASEWGQKQTGELFGFSQAKVTYVMRLARELQKTDSPFWKMDQQTDALRWLFRQEEDQALALLAKEHIHVLEQPLPKQSEDLLTRLEDQEKSNAKEQYLANPHNDPNQFEEYWQSRQVTPPIRVNLTSRLYLGNCLTYLQERSGWFNHIITDPPYAIDTDNLDQSNLGLAGIDTVRDTHQVEENTNLLSTFLPLAYRALKESGWLLLWCDITKWQFLTDEAMKAGFKVQRWPIVWVKTHPCLNSMVNQNFTKTTELVFCARKGKATLIKPPILGHILAEHDEFKELGHPFVKPFVVWEHLISAVSIEGESVLDPFAGVGSGVISAARLRRNFFACELEVTHYNQMLEALKKHYKSLNSNTEFL